MRIVPSKRSHLPAIGHVLVTLTLFGLGFSLNGCSGPQSTEIPDGLPVLDADWTHLVGQIPSHAEAVILVSLDETVGEDVSEVWANLDMFTNATALISDAFGIDLDAPSAFDELGLLMGGGAAFFVVEGNWVGLFDLSEPSQFEHLLEGFEERNPDLFSEWREVDGLDVLTVWLPTSDDSQPNLHFTVADSQALVLLATADEPEVSSLDDILVSIVESSWSENVLRNPEFVKVLDRFGGSSWGIYYVGMPVMFETLPRPNPGVQPPGFFGVAPSRERCEEVERAIASAIPLVYGAIERQIDQVGGNHLERVFRHLVLSVDPLYRYTAAQLLSPHPIDREVLERDAVFSGYLSLHPATLAENFADLAEMAACNSVASFPGILGLLGSYFEDTPELQDFLTGMLAIVVFDLRNSGGAPFADIFVLLGSDRASELSRLLEEAIESNLMTFGTVDETASLRSVHYRIGDGLYRLGLFEGPTGLGLSLGRVYEQWLEEIFAEPEVSPNAFLRFYADGERCRNVCQVILDLGVESPIREIIESLAVNLEQLLLLRVNGVFSNNQVEFEVIEERLID